MFSDHSLLKRGVFKTVNATLYQLQFLEPQGCNGESIKHPTRTKRTLKEFILKLIVLKKQKINLVLFFRLIIHHGQYRSKLGVKENKITEKENWRAIIERYSKKRNWRDGYNRKRQLLSFNTDNKVPSHLPSLVMAVGFKISLLLKTQILIKMLNNWVIAPHSLKPTNFLRIQPYKHLYHNHLGYL